MGFVEFERERFFSRLIWLVPVAYFFHVVEEANGFDRWVADVVGGEIGVGGFYRNNAVFMIITLGFCSFAYLKRTRATTFLFFLWSTAGVFWNFVFHLYGQYRFHVYSPGYFTATLLYLPIFCYLSYVCLREKFLSWYLWAIAFVGSLAIMAFVLWAGLYHLGPIPWGKWF